MVGVTEYGMTQVASGVAAPSVPSTRAPRAPRCRPPPPAARPRTSSPAPPTEPRTPPDSPLNITPSTAASHLPPVSQPVLILTSPHPHTPSLHTLSPHRLGLVTPSIVNNDNLLFVV
ncbi:unnamed protein product [Spodoptera littoralis]|uniref:Uncharacterized protein n=1 Tax=Spodoptera littoralis TaxID=7109 RepID=A0A9P0N9A1_SPOLI|nr:unnamed protein product [Spodoptera littoralis]CAH1646194.1 unnamed protein product [Spodoptera littoralis]